eukprot:79705_1
MSYWVFKVLLWWLLLILLAIPASFTYFNKRVHEHHSEKSAAFTAKIITNVQGDPEYRVKVKEAILKLQSQSKDSKICNFNDHHNNNNDNNNNGGGGGGAGTLPLSASIAMDNKSSDPINKLTPNRSME